MLNRVLAIGIDEYQSINRLNNCVNDLDAIIDILVQKYDFATENVSRLYNKDATQENILFNLEEHFANQSSGENLLIFFSGHGDFNSKLDLGYFLPVECIEDNKSTYIPNTTFFNYVRAFEYRHVILISDSCFSGSIFSPPSRALKSNIRQFEIPSKWALTSGRLERVSDGLPGENSPFAKAIIDSLKNNKADNLSMLDLTRNVISNVSSNHDQIPRGAPLQSLGDKGGEFYFIKRQIPLIGSAKKVSNTSMISNDEIYDAINEYYANLLKLEEAENQNKTATIKRLKEEENFINNVIHRELTKILEMVKSNMIQSNTVINLLGEDVKSLFNQLKEIVEQKNNAVKSQHYEKAADLRETETKIQKMIYQLIYLKKSNLVEALLLNEESVSKDFAILSILLDVTPQLKIFEKRELLNDSFTDILFFKLSKDGGHLSKYKFNELFTTFIQDTIPKIIESIFSNKIEIEEAETRVAANIAEEQKPKNPSVYKKRKRKQPPTQHTRKR